MDEHFDPDEIEELLEQERQKQGQAKPKAQQGQPAAPVNDLPDYMDPGMDLDSSDLPLPEKKPTPSQPNAVGKWFQQKMAAFELKKHKKQAEQAKKELKESRREMRSAMDNMQKGYAPKTHAENEEDKMIAREKKAQKTLGAAAAPIVLDTDHLNDTPPAKPNQRLISPPNTKVYTGIVVVALVVGIVVFRPHWVGNSWDWAGNSWNSASAGVRNWFKSTPETAPVATPVVEQPKTQAPAVVDAPVVQPTAPVTQMPVAGPNGLPPPPPPPPTALPGEVPNYSNFEVPKNTQFEKPTTASVERAQASAPVKEKRQKTQEQLQEEQERKMIEEQMKKLDTWGNR